MSKVALIAESRDEEQDFRLVGDKPKLKPLADALKGAIGDATIWRMRADLAEDAAWCIWDNQSDDGRKHSSDGENPPFPWENASDTRVHFVDTHTREAAMVCNAAYKRGRWKMAGVQSVDRRRAQKMSVLLKWMVDSKMKPDADRERKLANYWRNLYGVSITMVDWQRESGLVLEELDLYALAQVFGLPDELLELTGGNIDDFVFAVEQLQEQMEMDGGQTVIPAEMLQAFEEITNVIDLVKNPERESEFVGTLKELFPTVKRKRLREVAKGLREVGRAKLPQPVVAKDQPRRRALRVFEDVFFPVNTTSIQSAEWVAVRDWLSKGELIERQVSEEWDDKFVQALLNHEGVSSTDELATARTSESVKRWSGRRGQWDAGTDDVSGLYEVFTFYYLANDEYGVPCFYETVMSPHVAMGASSDDSLYAKHGQLGFAHGKLPFIEHVFWRDSAQLLENVGIPYLLYTYQNEIKTQRDYRLDASSISILPPMRRHIRDLDTPVVWGPQMPVYESVRGSTEFMRPPESRTALSIEIEKAVEHSAHRLVGAMDADIPPPIVQLHQQDLSDAYLDEEVEVHTQIFQLMQERMPEQEVMRVTGPLREPFKMSREEIQGQFDLQFIFDARMLDTEFATKKMKALIEIMGLDFNNKIDRDGAIEILINELDADWADTLMKNPEEAQQEEIQEEMMNVAMIMTGQEPPMKEGGQDFRTRLQYLQNVQRQSPVIQMALMENPNIAALYDNRLKHLSFMVEQHQVNAQTGKVGAKALMN